MRLKTFIATLGVLATTLAGPASAAEPKIVGAWEIERGSWGCTMQRVAQDGNGVLILVLGLNKQGNPESGISGVQLRIHPGRLDVSKPAELTYVLGPDRFHVRADLFAGAVFRGHYSTAVSPGLTTSLATAPTFNVLDAKGKSLFEVPLRRYADALVALKTCANDVSGDWHYGD